jgi:4'-phosphopantetheinyl transferase
MHLYVHEYNNIKDNRIKEVKDILFNNSLADYEHRMGLPEQNHMLAANAYGKPYFTDVDNIHFSISHSGRFWICLFDQENVGADIEDFTNRDMPLKRFRGISERFFTKEEQLYIFDEYKPELQMAEDIKKRFFRIWTAKEAYMKYTGNGFSEGFTKFSVLDESTASNYRMVPIDPKVALTFFSKRNINLDELITI